jgi:hypothetical protein
VRQVKRLDQGILSGGACLCACVGGKVGEDMAGRQAARGG